MAVYAEPFVLLFPVAHLHHRPLLRRDAADAQLSCVPWRGPVFPINDGRPIPRTRKLLEQFARPFSFSAGDGGTAMLLIGIGLVKKLLIADYLANNLVGRVFDTPSLYSSVEILIGIYGYALQLFFDFSGYTDIAMGAALLLGIQLPANFRRPYLAVNVAEFWRRWHITFSEWLRDYLLTCCPSGASFRCSLTATRSHHVHAGGLWHGISWNFLIWGVLHGWLSAWCLRGSGCAKFRRRHGGRSCWAG